MLMNLIFGKNRTVTAELPPKEAEMLFMAAAMYIEDTYADDFDDEDCGCCEDCEEDEDLEEDEDFEEDEDPDPEEEEDCGDEMQEDTDTGPEETGEETDQEHPEAGGDPDFLEEMAPKYKGLMCIECSQCGLTRFFNQKTPTDSYYCEYGNRTVLRNMRKIVVSCKCGKHWRYWTNSTRKLISLKCPNCGAPIDAVLNERRNRYQNA